MYSDRDKIELGSLVLDYIMKLKTVFQNKLQIQLGEGEIEIARSVINIQKYRGQTELDINLSSLVLHELLSGNNYLISGKIFQPIMQDMDGNYSSNKDLEITFNNTMVKYNSEQNEFEIIDDIDISYIRVN